jgi:hypothetical protein
VGALSMAECIGKDAAMSNSTEMSRQTHRFARESEAEHDPPY